MHNILITLCSSSDLICMYGDTHDDLTILGSTVCCGSEYAAVLRTDLASDLIHGTYVCKIEVPF